MNFEEEMKRVLKDGEVAMGERSARKAVLTGRAKMVVVAANAPEAMKEDLSRYSKLSGVKYYVYPESAKELGYTCAKPFPVATFAVVKEGSSKILKL